MSALLISYDLGVPESSEDYKRVIDHIKSHSTWAKPLYSVWIVKTDKTCATMRNELKALVDSNDKVLVVDVTGDGWGSYNLSKEVTDWMEKHM